MFFLGEGVIRLWFAAIWPSRKASVPSCSWKLGCRLILDAHLEGGERASGTCGLKCSEEVPLRAGAGPSKRETISLDFSAFSRDSLSLVETAQIVDC